LKRKLLEAVAAGRAREAELEAFCVDGPAHPDGHWTAKDHLAHLSWWRSRNADLMDAVRTGEEPPPSVVDDEQNAVIYASRKDTSVADLKSEARASWDRLADAIAACTEDDLARPHPYATGATLLDTVSGNGQGHLAQHLMFWHLEHGDEAKAEAAQKWAYELDTSVARDERHRAFAAYNLGCFYARTGHAAEALPLLRKGLAGAPELDALARKDPDLDPIRESAGLKELLAT